MGAFHFGAREGIGLSRREVAEKMGVSVNAVRWFELGLGYKEMDVVNPLRHYSLRDVLKPETINLNGPKQSFFPRRFAEAIGQPQIYDRYLQNQLLDRVSPS